MKKTKDGTMKLIAAAVVLTNLMAQQSPPQPKVDMSKVQAAANKTVVPSLEQDGFLSDPDIVLKAEEKKDLRQFLEALQRQTGVKVTVAIRQSLPPEILKAADYESTWAGFALMVHYATEWKLGSHSSDPRRSFLIFIGLSQRGWAWSGSKELELALRKNMEATQKSRTQFYRIRRLARLSSIHANSPTYLALVGFLAELEPTIKATGPHKSP